MVGKQKLSRKRKARGKADSRKKCKGDSLRAKKEKLTTGGDDDDFEYVLDDMLDSAPQISDDIARDIVQDLLEAQQDAVEVGGSDEDKSDEAKLVKRTQKRKRVKGPKPSAVEFEASRQLAAEIAESSAADQADWLWNSYQKATGASSLERDGLTADCLVELAAEGTLEEKLKLLEPQWRAKFCKGATGSSSSSSSTGGGGNLEGPKGAPILLLVSPAAMGAIKLIKHCPTFHKACRIAKLFAKHIKVPEQQELLTKSVVCVGAGTPNRITKLADLEALRLDNLKYVVLDTALDAKQRTILDIPETRSDWWELLSKHFKKRLAAGQIKLALVNSDKLT